MVVIRPVQDREAGFWPQIVQVDIGGNVPSTEMPVILTIGRFEVSQILAWDEEKHFV